MMMHTIGFILAAAGFVYLPRTDRATLGEYSLDQGEIVYEEMADGTASAWVGGEAGRLPVTDPSALRGYAIEEVALADFAVVKTANVTYDGVSNAWYIAGVGSETGTVTFISKSGREIHSIFGKVHKADAPAPSPGGWGDATIAYDGPTCVVTLTKDGGCARVGWEFRSASVSASDGRINYETDLQRHVFALRDRLGLYDLCDLRQWVRDEAAGRTADCWANYPATNTVRLADRRLHWDGRGRFSSGMNYGGDWTLSAGGIDAVSVHFEGTPTTSNALVITGFVVTNGQSIITYDHDIDNFNPDELLAQECRDLKAQDWQTVTSGITKDGNRFIIDNPPDLAMRFFRLFYEGQVSQVLVITLNGQINITGDVGINGTNLVSWMRGCVTGIDVNGERAAVTNGVAYVHVSGGGTDADEVRGLIDDSFAGGTNAVNELTSYVSADTNNHPVATLGGVAAAAASSVVALGGTVVEPPVEVDWWQGIVDATPEMRIGTYGIPNGTAYGHRSSDTLAIYDGHVTDYSWKGGDFARYSLDFNGSGTTLTYLGGSTGFANSIGGCFAWDGMTAYVHDGYGCGQYSVNEPFGAVLSSRKHVSAFFGYACAISRDGLHFLGLSGSDIVFYDLSVPNDLTTGRLVGTLRATTLPGMSDFTCHSFAVSPDGEKLILVNQTANLALISLPVAWNSANATLVKIKTFGTNSWTSVAFDDRGLLTLGTTDATSASIHVFYTNPQPVESRYQTKTNGVAVTATLADLPLAERVVVGIDGDAVTNLVTDVVYERDGVNEIVSNRWTQTAERGVLPDYTATGAKVGSVGYDAILTYTTNGTLTLPAPARVRMLAVGGGGGGAHGGNYFGRTQTGGAGGGGGGAVETNVTLAAGTYTFAPGVGGAGGQPISGGGSGGATTIAFGGTTILEVPGGGGGGNYAQPGRAGGCGGGAGGMNTNDVTCAASTGDPGCFGGAPGADSNGFVRLEWVESTVAGRQVVEIDSVTFDQTIATEITLRGMFTGTASGWQSLCGFSTEGGSLITRNPSNRFGNDKLGFAIDGSKLATAPVTIVWTVGRINGVNRQTLRVVYQDETEDTASATGTLMPGDIGRPLTLFGVGALAGGIYNFADFRLYSAVIRQDGVLKAELVPALRAGGVAGLYDEVSGRFLAPTGTESLACSPYADQYPGSGGGGMGTMGEGATATAAGRGGDGIASDITGETVYYAGGGGGGSALSGVSGGAGGLGGGGTGVTQGTEPAQKAGLDGFGAGGGGGGSGAFENSNGGAGGRGVVIVRIEHTGVVTNTVPYALMTDVPSAEEWQAVKARLAEIEARLNAAGGE